MFKIKVGNLFLIWHFAKILIHIGGIMAFVFDVEANREKLDGLKETIHRIGPDRGNLMAVLHEAQSVFGYLPIEVQTLISEEMKIPLAEIYGVATFYAQFSLIPKGKHTIGLCLGTACYVRGAQAVLDEVQKELSIEVGGTTEDQLFSLEATRCIGACGLAPVMTISGDVYGKLKPKEIHGILEKYRG